MNKQSAWLTIHSLLHSGTPSSASFYSLRCLQGCAGLPSFRAPTLHRSSCRCSFQSCTRVAKHVAESEYPRGSADWPGCPLSEWCATAYSCFQVGFRVLELAEIVAENFGGVLRVYRHYGLHRVLCPVSCEGGDRIGFMSWRLECFSLGFGLNAKAD